MTTNGVTHTWACKECGTVLKPNFSNLDTSVRPFKLLCDCPKCNKITELGVLDDTN